MSFCNLIITFFFLRSQNLFQIIDLLLQTKFITSVLITQILYLISMYTRQSFFHVVKLVLVLSLDIIKHFSVLADLLFQVFSLAHMLLTMNFHQFQHLLYFIVFQFDQFSEAINLSIEYLVLIVHSMMNLLELSVENARILVFNSYQLCGTLFGFSFNIFILCLVDFVKSSDLFIFL